MELFQEYFLTALLGLVFACVIAKLVSVALYGDDNKAAVTDDTVKVVEKQVKVELDHKGLRVRGAKSKKRVKFADDVVVKHVDRHHYQFEVEEESNDSDIEIKRVVNDDDDACDEGSESSGILVESMEKMIVEEKGEIFARVDQVDDHMVNDHDVCAKGSESTGIVIESMEGVIVKEKSVKGEIFTSFGEIDDQGVKKDVKVMLCSDKVVGVGGDDGEKVSKNMGLLDEEAVEGKSEDIKADESCSGEEENVVISGVDSSTVEEKMQRLEGLLVEAKTENAEVPVKTSVGLKIDNVAIGIKESSGVVRVDEDQGGLSKRDEEEAVNDEGVIDDDDDWEGIERTELEKRFGEAVNYIECKVKGKDDQLAKLGSDVQMQLYGLHKIVVEGPCREPQPLPLNFSARAKWNAWQKLGSMSPEVAMEGYIKLVSENIPSLGQNYSAQDGKQGSSQSIVPDGPDPGSAFRDTRPNIIPERELESSCDTKGDDPTAGANTG